MKRISDAGHIPTVAASPSVYSNCHFHIPTRMDTGNMKCKECASPVKLVRIEFNGYADSFLAHIQGEFTESIHCNNKPIESE